MNRKALGIAFISGVLLCGLGGGVAFGQYSKLEYAGERKIGEENLVTETFESQIEGDGKIYVDAYAAWEGRRLETDESIPLNKIVFDVTYNSDKVSMDIEKSIREPEPDRYVKVVNEDGEVIDYEEYYSEDSYSEDRSMQKGEVFHVGRYRSYDDVRDFFEAKDIFLSDLKKGKIGSYRVIYIESVTVKVNPANVDRVQLYY